MRLMLVFVTLALLVGCASSPSRLPPRIDRISPEELDRRIPKPVPTMTLDEIVRLSQSGESPDAIVARLRESHSTYRLTPAQVVELHREGVDMRVLDEIFNAEHRAMRDSLADEFNRREREHRQEIDQLKRQLLYRQDCDPFWTYPYRYPYWKYR